MPFVVSFAIACVWFGGAFSTVGNLVACLSLTATGAGMLGIIYSGLARGYPHE